MIGKYSRRVQALAKQQHPNSSGLHIHHLQTRLGLQNNATQTVNWVLELAWWHEGAHADAGQAVCATQLVTWQTVPCLDKFYVTHRALSEAVSQPFKP